MDINAEESNIQSFYAGKTIFITGTTGFLGKVLLEKLLYSCKGILEIWILIRTKGQLIEERLEKLLHSPVFDRLKRECPEALFKIRAVEGDITKPLLGISAADLEQIFTKVNVIFHSAASVKFNESLKESSIINILGTKHVVDLARKIHRLASFVHVSTAFSNCNRNVIEEGFYPPPIAAKDMVDITRWMSENMMEHLREALIDGRPNTYTLVKSIAESYIKEYASDLPVAIVRPSVITVSWREPFPGWVEFMNGPTGSYVLLLIGLLKSVVVEPKAIADMIPVDIVINQMIAVSWITGLQKKNPPSINLPNKFTEKEPVIYNQVSCNENPITWKSVYEFASAAAGKYPSNRCIQDPSTSTTRYKVVYYLRVYFLYFLASLLDITRMIRRKEAKGVHFCKKMMENLPALFFFSTRAWDMKSGNIQAVFKCMSTTDRKEFPFGLKELDWPSYIESHVLGARTHILKEPMNTLPAARLRLEKLLLKFRIAKAIIAVLGVSIFVGYAFTVLV